MAAVDMECFPLLSVRDCSVVGLERFALSLAGEEEEFFEIRTEWSDKSITYMRRRYHDLVKLVKNMSMSFPDDRGRLSKTLIEALHGIKEAEESSNVESRLDAVEKLLRSIIKMPQKSEAILTFFKTSPLDYTLKTMYEPVQPLYQSPVTIADVRRANGFCLANTETVIFDAHLKEEGAKPSSKNSSEIESQMWTGMTIQNGIRCFKETINKPGKGFMTTESKDTDCQSKKSQTTANNMTYLHLHACETDILE